MELVVLVGISRRALDSLLRSPYRTLEIKSARNIEALENLESGKRVFLTYETFQDITRGIEGLIAEIMKVERMEQKILWEESDEREQMVYRVQLKLVGLGKILEVEEEKGVLRARVREMLPHEMSMG
ncbi:DUF473 domain-containing protein [Thermococci archaeon]|uniref:DUF473 domain-containing protein n=1 Tax=Palaeococcus sp. (in: euryarchaeotes) TaxID=2820298 RepID=UPI000F2C594A|nr:DUF473 domain-containing protein [Palaeococcus sp. (in: euryarchaeotes)]MCD6559682.1 DUF473 domain-containing protein [Palaeococcus sp. (in: euryarchaeotes)]RLF76006.1 MAG: DUF473 domain-containing protein [Thermococci archaeon]RLF89740.1 MAG: DUF473 domain-containing protein [Thermococci archaeon]